jgi:Tol biopolymer transport system component
MPQNPDTEVIYNIGGDEAGTKDGSDRAWPYFRSAIRSSTESAVEVLPMAIADLSPDGSTGVGINFSRLFDFRPGYGYSGRSDPYAEISHPDNDGIFIIDTENKSSRLILNYPAIRDFVTEQRGKAGRETKKLVINHINFSPDGERLVFICRDFPGEDGNWGNAFFTVNTDGSGLYCLSDFGLVSHYIWRDPAGILAYADGHGDDWGLFLYSDRSSEAVEIDSAFFTSDGHCSYSPCGRYILYDSYPHDDGHRYLFIYDLEEKRGHTLGAFYSDPHAVSDWRCDLHPRWNRDGSCITFDSTHEGFRAVYLIETDTIGS